MTKSITTRTPQIITIERTYLIKPLLMIGTPLLFLGLLLAALMYAMNTEDRMDCRTWAREARTYPHFYLTQTQKEQCDYWHIDINAPVK